MTSFISFSLFLKAGFISVSVIWFFALCLYNFDFSPKKKFKIYYILLFPITLLAIQALSVLFSEDLTTAGDIIMKKIHLFLIPIALIIANKKISDRDLNVINAVFLTGCLVCSLVCISNSIFKIFWYTSLGTQGYYFFTGDSLTRIVNIEPIYLSMYCSFAFLIAVTTPLIQKPGIRTAVTLYLAFFIILIYSKTGILCISIIAILWSLTTSHKKNVPYFAFAIFIVTVTISFYRLPFSKEKFLNSFEFYYTDSNNNASIHKGDYLKIWSSALQTIKEKPIMGYGIGDSQKALEETYQKNGFVEGVKDSLNPHNEFFSIVLDVGVIGFFVLMSALLVPLAQAMKARNFLAIGFFLIVGFYFLIESVLARQKGIVFFSFFYSLIACQLAKHKFETIPKSETE